jgi:UDP-N-acetylglucosamine 4,6-dehydratase
MSNLKGRKIFISGGLGAFGRKFAKYAISQGAQEIILYSRDEMKHSALKRESGLKQGVLTYWIGDILDTRELTRAMNKADLVIHAAAMKHLPECESNIWASTRTNVVGTHNMLEAFQDSPARDFIFLSSDKAPYASTAYGSQKLIAEKLVTEFSSRSGKRTFNLRYSNVIDSTGAVFHIFLNSLKQGKTVSVNGEGTFRGFVSQDQVLSLISSTLEVSKGGETYVMKPKVVRISDLARAMHRLIGQGEVNIKTDMSFSGEKESATLIMKEELAFVSEALPGSVPAFVIDNLKRHSKKPVDLPSHGLTLDDCATMEKEELENFLKPLLGDN